MSPFIIVSVIVFVGVLVFVHELGHFLVAKFFDIKVTKFSLGFGPPLASFTWGETTYQVAAIPLGGFVLMVGAMPGEPVPEADRGRAFTDAAIYQRALVTIAGPAMNLVFPVLCFFAYNIMSPTVMPPVVGQVARGEAADQAGLRPGDRILSVAGERTWSFPRLRYLIQERPGVAVPIEVQRGEEKLSLEITPKSVSGRDVFGKPKDVGLISISWTAAGSRVAVDDRARLPPGLDAIRNGDRIVAVDGEPVRRGDALPGLFAKAAGRTVDVRIVRHHPVEAGDMLFAAQPAPATLKVSLPGRVESLEAIGLGLGGTFVRSLVAQGPAEKAGLRPGDRILALNGEPVQHFWRFQLDLTGLEGKPAKVRFRRGAEVSEVTLQAAAVRCRHVRKRDLIVEYDSGFGRGELLEEGDPCVGLVRPDTTWGENLNPDRERIRLTIDEALTESARLTFEVIRLILQQLVKMLTREVSTDDVGGPLQFFSAAAEAAKGGIFDYLQMLAVISINLGIMNLLPLPVLDGGQLMFCLVEAVKKKPLSAETREKAALIGLAMLAALLLLALSNDIRRLGLF